MNLDNAVKRAETVQGEKSAARLYSDIEYELAMGDPTPEQERQGEDAIRVLEGRYPDVKQRADDVMEDGHIPNLSNTAKRRMHLGQGDLHEQHKARTGPNETTRRQVRDRRPNTPAPPSSRRPAPAPAPTRSSGRSRSSSGWGSRAVSTASDLSGGWGDAISTMFLWGIGLSMAYLLLTHAKGPSELVTGATTLVTAIVRPTIDPLNPKG